MPNNNAQPQKMHNPLQLATVGEVSQDRAPCLSVPPDAHVGNPAGCVLLAIPTVNTFFPALWAHNVAIVLAHFPVTLVGSSFSACTLCTATLRRADPPYPSMPCIELPVAPPY
jgi:hypothetical protein